MKLILLGAPGAGKGTQAEVICKELKIPAVSTGGIIREAIKNGTEWGVKAKSYVDAGALAPDELVIEMLKQRISLSDCENGYILDGFPRTVPQAEALDKMGVVIDKVLDIEVPDEMIEERLAGRRMCGACGANYHIRFLPPEKDGVCGKCGGELTARKDDELSTVRERLKAYHRQTEPLKDYYAAAGKLVVVDGRKSVEETSRLVLAALEA